MTTAPAVPLLKRVPSGVWIALAWCAATVYGTLTSLGPAIDDWNPRFFNLWSLLIQASIATVIGGVLVDRRPIMAHTLIVVGATGSALCLNSTAIAFVQFITVAVALLIIAGSRPRRTSLAALTVTLSVLTAYGVVRELCGWPVILSTQIAVALAAIVMWFIGDTTRQAREHARDVGAHAMAQAAANERLRIARELHDMIAHTVGVIALQAGAAAMLIDAEPAKARTAVDAIESTSRETLSGLRRMLVSLRSQDSDTDGSAPMPGLADVDRLAAATTAAGVRVEVEWRGGRRPVPPEVGLAGFRIVQESVTNVVRHAGTDRCRVTVTFAPDALAVEVTDDGSGGGSGSRGGGAGSAENGGATHVGGYGLVGIRERVALLGGEFEAGPRPAGGFRVAARIPVEGI